MSAKKDYKIGYKRPPTDHRFKPGQSGNPAGRPKGSKKFSTMLHDALNRKVTISGSKRKISIGDAVLMKLASKALTGELKAQAMVVTLMERHLAGDTTTGLDPELRAKEQAILAQFFAAEGGGDESESD